MKIIKIGRSNTNDIVISDMTVSSEHAKIIISELGHIQVKDLNSKNGTYINGTRITNEVTITASDEIKVAGVFVDWLSYLNKNQSNKESVFGRDINSKNIGRSEMNDIVISHNDVSGMHATLIKQENGDIVIKDLNSKNGTYVNGNKIDSQILRSGDIVLIAKKYPLRWQSVFNETKPKPTKNLHWPVYIGIVAVAIIGFCIWQPLNSKRLKEIDVFKTYKKSVALIYFNYSYHVYIKDKDFEYWSFDENGDVIKCNGENNLGGWGTGFFVSKDGKLITNRHIVAPWEYEDGPIEIQKIKTYIQELIIEKAQTEDPRYSSLVGDVSVKGEISLIGIFVNDTYVNSLTELIPCSIINVSDNIEEDVALIQVNAKSLPTGVTKFVDLNQAVINSSEVSEGTEIYSLGFPTGPTLSNTKQGIEANCQDGKITQLRGDVEFGHNIPSFGGASGSPIFNKYGQLLGIHHAGASQSITQGFNMAIWAKYAVQLVK